VVLIMNGLQDVERGSVRDGSKAVDDEGGAAGVKGVGVEVEGAALIGCLEDVGDVSEEDVVEQIAEERAHDAAFGVVALPALRAVPA